MSIYTKLFEFQKNMPPLVNDSINPFYESSYLSLPGLIAQTKPYLIEQGLALNHKTDVIEGENILITSLVDKETGEKIDSKIKKRSGSDIQQDGSIDTYLRRYEIKSLLGIESQDDDGNSVTPKHSKTDQAFELAKKLKETHDYEEIKKILEESGVLKDGQRINNEKKAEKAYNELKKLQ